MTYLVYYVSYACWGGDKHFEMWLVEMPYINYATWKKDKDIKFTLKNNISMSFEQYFIEVF